MRNEFIQIRNVLIVVLVVLLVCLAISPMCFVYKYIRAKARRQEVTKDDVPLSENNQGGGVFAVTRPPGEEPRDVELQSVPRAVVRRDDGMERALLPRSHPDSSSERVTQRPDTPWSLV